MTTGQKIAEQFQADFHRGFRTGPVDDLGETIDQAIADAVATEREACAQVAEDSTCGLSCHAER